MKLALVPAAVAMASILGACGGGGTTPGAPAARSISGGLGSGGSQSFDSQLAPANPGQSSAARPNAAASDPVLQAQSAQKLIQDATLTLRISKGSFDSVSQKVIDIAQGAGGILFSMQTLSLIHI